MSRQLLLPLTEEVVLSLRAGDEVELTGTVITARDQACARLFTLILSEENLPVDLEDQLIYFVGPSPARPGQVIGSAGPTTSGRMSPFLPTFLERGLRGFIGKGYLDQVVKDALMKHRSIYFGAIGGSGALLSKFIEEAKVIAFPELLSEAIRQLRLKRFPGVVLNDAHGGDLYARATEGIA